MRLSLPVPQTRASTAPATNRIDRRVSVHSSCILSDARASASTSAMPASDEDSNEPNMLCRAARSSNRPRETPPAVSTWRRSTRLSSVVFTIWSSIMKPSTGSVNCSTTSAMDTVLNLL